MDLSIIYLIAGCDEYHTSGRRRRLLNLERLDVLLAGPISHTGAAFNTWISKLLIFHWVCLQPILLILEGVEFPFCIAATVVALS